MQYFHTCFSKNDYRTGLVILNIVWRKVSKQESKQICMQVSGHGSTQVLATYAQQGTCSWQSKKPAVFFVNQLNATNPKSIKTQFQFQFELSLAKLSPSLFNLFFFFCLEIFLRKHIIHKSRMSWGCFKMCMYVAKLKKQAHIVHSCVV